MVSKDKAMPGINEEEANVEVLVTSRGNFHTSVMVIVTKKRITVVY